MSPQLQSIFSSLVQQCKSELMSEAATHEQIAQTEITRLRAEVEEQKQRTREAEENYKEAAETWQIHHEQQGEMIVNLGAEVREWKERFEKLNKKVQIFIKDD